MRVLVAEDDRTTAHRMRAMLRAAGHEVALATDGQEAISLYEKGPFDAIVTDWMMPRVDGIELIRRVRNRPGNPPIVVMVTAIDSEEGRNHALAAGADAYLSKPCDAKALKACLDTCLARRDQQPTRSPRIQVRTSAKLPPFVGVGIAASTGGPDALVELFKSLPASADAAFFVVLHGPAWMLEVFAERLDKLTSMAVHHAESGTRAAPGNVYLAPGERHLVVAPGTMKLRLLDEPPENYVRPAADPLFRSIAQVFGENSAAVVMTGLGCDGAAGAAAIATVGGLVLVQEPETATAPSMPRNTIKLGIASAVVPLAGLGQRLGLRTAKLCEELAAARG